MGNIVVADHRLCLYMFDQYIEQDWAEVLSSNFVADLSTFYEQDIKNHIARYCVTQTFHFDSNFYLVGTSRASDKSVLRRQPGAVQARLVPGGLGGVATQEEEETLVSREC